MVPQATASPREEAGVRSTTDSSGLGMQAFWRKACWTAGTSRSKMGRGAGRMARAAVLPQPLEGTHRDRAEWGCTGAKESTGDRIMWAELRFRVTEGERNV